MYVEVNWGLGAKVLASLWCRILFLVSCRSRYLRKEDRTIHGIMKFPKLYYPELYLIEGGYKAFFEHHSVSGFSLC